MKTELPLLDSREHEELEKLAHRRLSNTEAHEFRKQQLLADAADYFLGLSPDSRKKLVQECERR